MEGKGGTTRGQLALTTVSEDPEEPSGASSKLGLFTGRGAFGRGRSFGGEVVLLARSTGQHGSRPRRAEFRVDGSPGRNKSCEQRTLRRRGRGLSHPRLMGGRGLSPAPDRDAGPETEEMPSGDKGGGDGSVRVLKHEDQGRRRTRLEQARGPNP